MPSPSSPPPSPSTPSSPSPVLRAFRNQPPDPGPSAEILAARWRDFLAAFGLPLDSNPNGVIQKFDRQGELLESLLPASIRVAPPPLHTPFIGLWGNASCGVESVGVCLRPDDGTYLDTEDDGHECEAPVAWIPLPDLSLLQEPPGDVSSAPTSGA